MGAWIEITFGRTLRHLHLVAPHMGAWIEINIEDAIFYLDPVAPHMGAWIEIRVAIILCYDERSHPTWVRGLKWFDWGKAEISIWSHPTWVRGLK